MRTRRQPRASQREVWIDSPRAAALLGISRATLLRLGHSRALSSRLIDEPGRQRCWVFELKDVLRVKREGTALRQYHAPRKVPSFRELWQQTFGRVPYGCRAEPRDRDESNRSTENLCLVAEESRRKLSGSGKRRPRANWTPELIAQLRDRFPRCPTDQLARELQLSAPVIRQKAKRLGLRKDGGYLSTVARERRRLPLGTERVKEASFVWVKIGFEGAYRQQWRPKHHVIWEKAHGRKVPDGFRVIFRDGNKRNFDIGNLELMALAEVSARAFGEFLSYPESLQKAAKLTGKLQRVVRRMLAKAPQPKRSRAAPRRPRSQPVRWTAEMDRTLRRDYPAKPLPELVSALGLSLSSVRNRAKRLKVRRTPEAMIKQARLITEQKLQTAA